MKKKIVRRGIGIGAAAVMSVGLSGCPGKKVEPADEKPAEAQTRSQAKSATTEGSSEPAATQEATGSDEEASTGEGEQEEATGESANDDGAEKEEAGSEKPAVADMPDCKGKDRFTEKCGYKSPTRYAVLDPATIVNV